MLIKGVDKRTVVIIHDDVNKEIECNDDPLLPIRLDEINIPLQLFLPIQQNKEPLSQRDGMDGGTLHSSEWEKMNVPSGFFFNTKNTVSSNSYHFTK